MTRLMGFGWAAWLGFCGTLFAQTTDNSKQPFSFRDVGVEAGLLPAAKGIMGHGAGWGDVNGDGWPDLYVATFHY
ncbi:MAG: FG-GAP repeat protein, partial [Planctomycetaceae bacterium]|nr:FG-GAP repeat protein [Planctomycetaceae bacterium]